MSIEGLQVEVKEQDVYAKEDDPFYKRIVSEGTSFSRSPGHPARGEKIKDTTWYKQQMGESSLGVYYDLSRNQRSIMEER